MSPIWQQQKLREFCEAKGIHITACSPLGASGTKWGNNRVIGCDVLEEIAKTKGKTTAQVLFEFFILSIFKITYRCVSIYRNIYILVQSNFIELAKEKPLPSHK